MAHIDEDALAAAYNEALRLEKAGEHEAAAPLYRQCLTLDPADTCGASIRLASMGLADAPAKAPDAYIATLFDQHADDFDDILTGQLGYAVPMQAAQIMAQRFGGPYARMLDLGCGTGLSGMMLQDMCEYAIGVDISENMVEAADERAAYDALYVNEAVHFLEEWAKSDDPDLGAFDLIVFTDVLPYIGALEPLFEGLRANATDGARLVFSSETLPDDIMARRDWSITPHQRYAHSAPYLRRLCTHYGFGNIDVFDEITVRSEQGKPIAGYLVIASAR